jgi:hypothetical protein
VAVRLSSTGFSSVAVVAIASLQIPFLGATGTFVGTNPFEGTVLHRIAVSGMFAQTNASKPCPIVKPRNSAEALKMENSSNHNGCWIRQADGSLVFLSDKSPDQNYKPALDSAPDIENSGGLTGAPGQYRPPNGGDILTSQKVVGRWHGNVCQFADGIILDFNTDTAGRLTGKMRMKNILTAISNKECDNATWDGKVDEMPIQNVRIDGNTLTFSITADGNPVNMKIKMFGNQLILATPSTRDAEGFIPGERYVLNKSS